MRITKAPLLFLCAIIVASLLLPIGSAEADQEEAPFDYAIITADKEYIFVMLIPDEEIMQAWRQWYGEEPLYFGTAVFDIEIPPDGVGTARQETFWLRSKYPCSGLYKNDGSITPIWTIDSYGLVYLVDEEHLILRGPWNYIETSPEGRLLFDGLAVAFYKNGYVLASYSVSDLIKDKEAINFSVSHYEWREKEEFDRDTGLLSMETVDHQKYNFDIREMGKNVEEKNVECIPNYRFGITGPITEPPKIVISTKVVPTPERTESVPSIERNEYSVFLIAVIVFVLIVGCATFIGIIRKRRR